MITCTSGPAISPSSADGTYVPRCRAPGSLPRYDALAAPASAGYERSQPGGGLGGPRSPERLDDLARVSSGTRRSLRSSPNRMRKPEPNEKEGTA